MKNIARLLVDQRSIGLLDEIPKVLACTNLAGLDIETEDSAKHIGLVDVKGDPIDFQRSNITGLSIYPDDADYAFYINLRHADVENRLPWETVQNVLDSYNETWIAHNAPFERAMFKLAQNWDMKKYICSMQLCVTAYNEDEYPREAFMGSDLGGIVNQMNVIAKAFADYDREKGLTHQQGKLVGKVLGKTTRGTDSYNGYVNSIKYGYGLKQAVKSWFGYEMQTFEQTLNGKDHMGQLTGDEVASYGADDAIWCVRLYHKVINYLMERNPAVIQTFFEQELPMCEAYADLKVRGLRVDKEQVQKRRDDERVNYAGELRKLKKTVQAVLPFPRDPISKMMDREDWYAKNWGRYRDRITDWAETPDSERDLDQCIQVSSPVGNEWMTELANGKKYKSTKMNLTHYMVTRTLFYDLLELPLVMDKGKLQSDAEARQSMYEDLNEEFRKCEDHGLKAVLQRKLDVLNSINSLSSIDQRMKLYLNPYMHLIDPDTGRVYPTLSSMLNSRRMATQFPNPMQLAKRGASTYVRGFYLADHDEDLTVSLDWSQVELVEIGEFSGDPEFAKAYGQTPYEDLHLGAAADCLSVMVPELTIDVYKSLKNMSDEEAKDHSYLDYLFRSTSGEVLSPSKAYKYWRTEVGKGANFNYWYSGALSTVGERLGWTPTQMWEATERYRERFKVAEEWRVQTIQDLQMRGYVELPDHHRRTRFEATREWEEMIRARFNKYADAANSDGIRKFAQFFINSVKRRAGNQGVNSMIQGSSATLAKRSVIRILKRIIEDQFHHRTRFLIPVHDELVFNVHKKEVWDFIQMAKQVMTTHPDIIKNLKLDCTASVGRTYEPFDMKKVPFGQVEIDEAPHLPFVPQGERDGKMSRDTVEALVQYLRP